MTEIEELIKQFAHIPGFGKNSARRAVLYLMKKREKVMKPLIDSMEKVLETINPCPICGNLDSQLPCHICSDQKRDCSVICVVKDISDLWALERSACFNGKYHVLNGVLSPIDGIGPEELGLPSLIKRLKNSPVKEIIMALPTSIEGQTTLHYISTTLKNNDINVKISSLARGIPFGGELDYMDDGTITLAIKERL